MKIHRLIPMLLAGMLLAACQKHDGGNDERTPFECVDPMIGTGFHGHTFPGATVPFGAVQLSPDTRSGDWDAAAGYHYADSALYGFSHTHLSGTGCTDLGDVLLRPTHENLDKLLTRNDDRRRSPGDEMHPATFSHDNEHAEPGYYSVRLDDGIGCELTATTHCGVHRYVFNAKSAGTASVVVDLAHLLSADDCVSDMEIEQTAPNEVQGYRITEGWSPDRHTYFVARFSKPATNVAEGNIRGILQLQFDKADTLVVAVGISQVSIEGAVRNLEAETDKQPSLPLFDRTRAAAAKTWAEALEKITVKGGTRDERTIFYTSLYRTMIAPNVVNDVDGQYRRANGTVATVPEGQQRYSTLSFWDTFRALHPLLTLTDSALVSDVCYSVLDWYDAKGELPIWPLSSGETECMIGYHSVSVLADAYLKGVWPAPGDEASAQRALDAMVRSSDINKKGSDYYVRDGFIPADRKRESISCLLEYTYDDWCIAAMAESMGKSDIAARYRQRALNYANGFDGATRFFRGKRADGNWNDKFDPYEAGRDYTEATAWQYRFGALHDVRGMVSLFGGRDCFRAALDSLFSFEAAADADIQDISGVIGQYAHGNEPSHHMAYLYNYIGMPWETQRLTREILRTKYEAAPDGICGNEDCGQMSAWYILSALGLYSVTPGSLQYNLTSPIFDEAVVRLNGGRKLVVRVQGNAKDTYVQRVAFSPDADAALPENAAAGTDIAHNFIDHARLAGGGTLTFVLTDRPEKQRGTADDDAPFSLSTGLCASIPYVPGDVNLFIDRVSLQLGSATAGADIHYTLDGSMPTAASPVYKQPITLEKTTLVRAFAMKKGMADSPVMSVRATRAEYLPAVSATTRRNGCNYRYFEGNFHRTADLSEGIEKDYGEMPEPSIKNALRADHFGYVFSGLIDVPAEGIYTFSTMSDDGSVLFIDGQLVVDNDGSHAAIVATGRIALAPGLHRYKVLYFEDYEGEEFSWGWCIPGKESLEKIPASRLFVE